MPTYGPNSYSILTSDGTEVCYIGTDGDTSLSYQGTVLTITVLADVAFEVARANTDYVESYTQQEGNSLTVTFKRNIVSLSITETQPPLTDDPIITFESTPRKSVDLATLSGWANLSSGAHSIQLKAKASGYRDSELSQAVSVTKAAEGYKVTINREYLYQEGLCFYSLDDGTTWIDGYASDYAQLVLNSVDQIRFKVVNNSNNFGFARSSTLNLNISANRGDEYSDNFTLTQDITDLEFGLSAD